MNSALARIGHAWLNLYGWKIVGNKPAVQRAVVVAAPHTTNWDLPFTIAGAWALGVEISWVGKHTIFKPPFGRIMRALGGYSVDRRARGNQVEAMADLIRSMDELYLFIAPEGTRKRAAHWKSGFYHVAVAADVPIVLGYLDYSRKELGLGHLFYPTGDIEKDFEAIREFYRDKVGKYPENMSDVRLKETERKATEAAA